MTAANYAVAPGEYLEEWIDDQGISQQRAAELLGSSRKHVNEIVNGRAPITGDTAMRLERVVGIPATAWLKYEAMYQADLARIADEENPAAHAKEIGAEHGPLPARHRCNEGHDPHPRQAGAGFSRVSPLWTAGGL